MVKFHRTRRNHAAALALLTVAAHSQSTGPARTPALEFPTTQTVSTSTCPVPSVASNTLTTPAQCLDPRWNGQSDCQSLITSGPAASSGQSQGIIISASTDSSRPPGPRDVVSANAQPSTVDETLGDRIITAVAAGPLKDGVSEDASGSSDRDQPVKPDQEAEIESPLDNVNFLSFDDWKRQNLAKAGQSAENLGTRAGHDREDKKRTPMGMHNALDSLGEDAEIDIDFGGFTSAGRARDESLAYDMKTPDSGPAEETGGKEGGSEELPSARRRGKDAGRTCKERSNYASFDCAATALKTNPECKGATSVLVENKDSYMLNVCSVKNKYLIVELCDAILIDTVVLANFEFFSSQFRTFKVSVSDRYPVKMDKWMDIGTYEARNSREVQAFLVENPLIWARYLRVEFLTHFGNEYYCPVSLLRVHGTTMMEEFNREVKESRGEDEMESSEMEEETGSSMIEAPPDIVSAEALKSVESPAPQESIVLPTSSPFPASSTEMDIASSSIRSQPVPSTQSYDQLPNSSSTISLLASDIRSMETCAPNEQSEMTALPSLHPDATSSLPSSDTQKVTYHSSIRSDGSQHGDHRQAISTGPSEARHGNTPINIASIEQGIHNKIVDTDTAIRPELAASVKSQFTSTQPAAPNPTTQESFFKSVHKRLQQLEANSTLSLQYIEDQSRILRDAFTKVEKRQLSKTSTFLEVLNATVLTELHDFRMQYEQIWQTTVLELSSQRELTQHEVSALSARLTFLADEVVFQKRMTIIQFTLILVCLGLVLFSRFGSASTYLELPPRLQNVVNKSSVSLSQYAHLETPPASPSSTRPSSSYGILGSLTRNRSPFDEPYRNGSAGSPRAAYSPPSPVSQRSGDKDYSASTDGSDSHSDVSAHNGKRVRMAEGSLESRCEMRSAKDDLDDDTVMTPKPDMGNSPSPQHQRAPGA